MGMTDDFEDAIACGSTMVRIGTAIFGPAELCAGKTINDYIETILEDEPMGIYGRTEEADSPVFRTGRG